MKCIAVIPARYASTRFPGKLLYEVEGKSILQRTYENISNAELFDEIVLATDDHRIARHAEQYCSNIVMTSSTCATGTERVCEAIKKSSTIAQNDIIVNVQADEPYLPKSTVHSVIHCLHEHPDDYMATACVEIHDKELLAQPSIVKCTFDKNRHALYFSRSTIPYIRNSGFAKIYKHIGIYAFRAHFIYKYAELTPTPLQQAEDLEQLKVLEHGYKIRITETYEETFDINIPEDIERLRKKLAIN